jgi:transposase InsO family protein
MPPRWRNHREPTGPDTPTATAASSLVKPSAILTQNARSTSRRGGGRPGDRIGARPVFVDIHAAVRPNVTPLLIGVLRRPLESAQYTSRSFADLCTRLGVTRSMGAVGSSADNALAESFNATLKRETLAGAPGWDSAAAARRAVFAWITRYNTRRRHSTCGQVSPVTYEKSSVPTTLPTAA